MDNNKSDEDDLPFDLNPNINYSQYMAPKTDKVY